MFNNDNKNLSETSIPHTLIKKIADKRARITNKNDSQPFNASKDKSGSSLFNIQAHRNVHTLSLSNTLTKKKPRETEPLHFDENGRIRE